jgi:hypothetical protein
MVTPSTAGGIRHGFSGAMYSKIGDDRVQVVMPSGAVGIFDGIGRWIELYNHDRPNPFIGNGAG